MALYIDGFVVPVPKKNIAAYKKMAKLSSKVFLEHGALQCVECMGDDVPPGKITSFPMSVKLKAGEVAFFSWIVYKSRAHRDRVGKKMMKDPRMMNMDMNRVFDAKRMIYGGFKPFVVVGKKGI